MSDAIDMVEVVRKFGIYIPFNGYLGIEPVVFPGDHGGFMGAPDEFAAALRAVLSD